MAPATTSGEGRPGRGRRRRLRLAGAPVVLGLAAGLLTGCGGGDDATAVSATASSTTTAPPPRTYAVEAGDTLAEVARAHGVTVEAVVAANGVADPDRIQVGQVLTIPDPPSPSPSSTTTTTTSTTTTG